MLWHCVTLPSPSLGLPVMHKALLRTALTNNEHKSVSNWRAERTDFKPDFTWFNNWGPIEHVLNNMSQPSYLVNSDQRKSPLSSSAPHLTEEWNLPSSKDTYRVYACAEMLYSLPRLYLRLIVCIAFKHKAIGQVLKWIQAHLCFLLLWFK